MRRVKRVWVIGAAIGACLWALPGCHRGHRHKVDDIEYRRVEIRQEQHAGEVREVPPGSEMIVE